MLNRNFSLVILANIVLGAAMPMLIILGALAGNQLAPATALATVPPSMQMVAGVIAATPISMFMARYGRRAGFLVGAALMVAGGIAGTLALLQSSFAGLIAAHVLLGAALICVGFFRFVAAEVVSLKWKPQAMSITLASGLFAALLGPELFNLAKDTFAPIPFAGAYMAIAGLGVAGAVLVAGLRGLAPMDPPGADVPRAGTLSILRRGPVALAVLASAASTALMLLMMVPTPLAMIGCGFGESDASDVIRWHVVAMFAPGFFTGAIIKRFGGVRVVCAGFALFALSALVAIEGIGLGNFYLALILLGVAWNFGYIGGSHLLQTALADTEKGRIQGVNDTLVALASALASLASGAVYAGIGWTAISAAILPVALVMATIMILGRRVSP